MLYRLGCLCGEWAIEVPGGLIDQIPDYQLYRWIEYYELEPFGEWRNDIRSALGFQPVVNSILAIAAGLAGKSSFEGLELKEFMYDKIREQIEKSRQEQEHQQKEKESSNQELADDDQEIEQPADVKQFHATKDLIRKIGRKVKKEDS